MVQVPGAEKVTDVPETVQMLVVAEVKVTVRPEVAVALTVIALPTVCAAMVPKLMLCGVGLLTWMIWPTFGAA